MNLKNIIKLIGFLCLQSFTSSLIAQSWQQQGADINHSSNSENLGYATSINANGNILAVGAPYNNEVAAASGQVRVYSWDGIAWNQMGSNINGLEAEDRLGYSLSMSADGHTIAIGVPELDNPVIEVGYVQVYFWDGTDWVQKGINVSGAGLEFGWAVSLSTDGETLAISALGGSGDESVYSWDGTAWIQKGLGIPEEAPNDLAGISISLSGDGNSLAIGASQNSAVANSSGHTRVFNWDGSDWIQRGADIDGEEIGDRSGSSVSLSVDGLILAVGAPWHRVGGTNTGHAKIFSWDGSSWIPVGGDMEGEANYDQFGEVVSLSGDGNTVAISAIKNDNANGSNSGHVRVFDRDGSIWMKRGDDVDGLSFTEESGTALSLSGDGNFLAIGVPKNSDNGFNSGVVRGFSWANATSNIEVIDLPVLTIGPNPTNGNLNIQLQESHQELIVDVRNISGVLMSSQSFFNTKNINIQIEGVSGIYLLTLKNKEGAESVFKILK